MPAVNPSGRTRSSVAADAACTDGRNQPIYGKLQPYLSRNLGVQLFATTIKQLIAGSANLCPEEDGCMIERQSARDAAPSLSTFTTAVTAAVRRLVEII